MPWEMDEHGNRAASVPREREAGWVAATARDTRRHGHEASQKSNQKNHTESTISLSLDTHTPLLSSSILWRWRHA